MNPSGERGQTTKTAAEDRRRLLAVGRADPFLVTKLPQNGTVANGIVKLDGGGILGFAHQPLPEGTRVRVAYQEWLYAERLPDDAAQVPVPASTAADGTVLEDRMAEDSMVEKSVAEEAVVDGAVVEGAVAEKAVAEEAVVEEAVAEEAAAEKMVAEKMVAEKSTSDPKTPETAAPKTAAPETTEMAAPKTAAAAGTAAEESLRREEVRGRAQRSDDEFPDDLARGGQEVPSVGEDGERKSWTDAFGSGSGGRADRET